MNPIDIMKVLEEAKDSIYKSTGMKANAWIPSDPVKVGADYFVFNFDDFILFDGLDEEPKDEN